jgi:hypothetical protein
VEADVVVFVVVVLLLLLPPQPAATSAGTASRASARSERLIAVIPFFRVHHGGRTPGAILDVGALRAC